MEGTWRHIIFFGLCLLLLPPFPAFADTALSAGFPQGSLWLSKSSLIEGESVKIFTPVYNAGKTRISADAVFTVDGNTIGTAHFELSDGESKIIFVPWTATAGVHSIKAHVENASDANLKQEISLGNAATGEIAVEVAPAPPKPAFVQALVDAADTTLPALGEATQSIFNATETLRKKAITDLQNVLAENRKASENASAQETTYRTPENSFLASLGVIGVGEGLPSILEQGLLFIVSHVWVFYPLLVLLLLGGLYALGKALSREHRLKKS